MSLSVSIFDAVQVKANEPHQLHIGIQLFSARQCAKLQRSALFGSSSRPGLLKDLHHLSKGRQVNDAEDTGIRGEQLSDIQ